MRCLTIAFALVFVRTLAEVEAAAATLLPKALGDAVVWFAYPKATSRRYRCEFNRDTGWAAVEAAGFEKVRQVAIDEDWSALRCPAGRVRQEKDSLGPPNFGEDGSAWPNEGWP